MMRTAFAVASHLAGSDVPATVIYGDRDSVFPTALSARFADRAPPWPSG